MARGFTFVELLVTMSILVIVTAMALPLATGSTRAATDAAARLLASDLEHAQMLALSRPDVRVALAIDADGTGWSIIDADAPGTPLEDKLDAAHRGRPLRTVLGEGRAQVGTHVVVDAQAAGKTLVFTPLGGLETRLPQVRMRSGETTSTLLVDADTGFSRLDH